MAKSKNTKQKHPKLDKIMTYVICHNGDVDTCSDDENYCMKIAKEEADDGNARYVLTYTLTKVRFVGYEKGCVPITDITKEIL